MKGFLIVWIALVLLSCSENDGDNLRKETSSPCVNTGCGNYVIIDSDLYNEIDNVFFNIFDYQLNDYCLHLIYTASGCDGSTFVSDLIDSGAILESLPVQRNLRFKLIDNEDCERIVIDTVYFDVSNLAIQGEEVILNIQHFDSEIRIQ